MPTRYTPSLTGTEDFRTDADLLPDRTYGLLDVIDGLWIEEDVEGKFVLDDWQRWLIRHALERYPDNYPNKELAGRLRWRQVVISMGRQNGKSVLGAIFGIYGLLMHMRSPRVVGLGYSQKTAKIVYDRLSYTINNQPKFKKVVRVTKVSGMKRKDRPGEYIVKPASEKAIQGFPITLCVFDEMHITPEPLWNAAKQGMKTKNDGIIIGLTTAGDTNSTLLNKLYKELDGRISATAADDTNRLGGFIWEAPEGSSLDTEGAIEAANPAVACGRVPLSVVRSDASGDPWVEQQRYVLNRFVEVFNSWIDMPLWHAVAGKGLLLSEGGPYVYAIDAAEDMNYATITMSAKVGDVIKTRTVASLTKPTIETLLKYCKYLRRKNGRAAFVVHKRSLNELGEKLKAQGFDVYNLVDGEFAEACKTTHRLIKWKKFEWADNSSSATLSQQVPKAIRKNYYGGWRLDKSHTSVELDALFATVMGAYIAETKTIGQVHVF